MEQPSNELGQTVGSLVPDWEPRPRPQRELIEGRYCRLEPLDPGQHAADLFAANSADVAGRSWTYLPYRRYEWKCNALNGASRAAAQRLGLSYEGTFRQAVVTKGRNRDTAWYAAIDSEWPSLRAAIQAWLDPDNFDSQGQQRTRLSDLTRPILKRWT